MLMGMTLACACEEQVVKRRVQDGLAAWMFPQRRLPSFKICWSDLIVPCPLQNQKVLSKSCSPDRWVIITHREPIRRRRAGATTHHRIITRLDRSHLPGEPLKLTQVLSFIGTHLSIVFGQIARLINDGRLHAAYRSSHDDETGNRRIGLRDARCHHAAQAMARNVYTFVFDLRQRSGLCNCGDGIVDEFFFRRELGQGGEWSVPNRRGQCVWRVLTCDLKLPAVVLTLSTAVFNCALLSA